MALRAGLPGLGLGAGTWSFWASRLATRRLARRAPPRQANYRLPRTAAVCRWRHLGVEKEKGRGKGRLKFSSHLGGVCRQRVEQSASSGTNAIR